jgi:hypothetical protein
MLRQKQTRLHLSSGQNTFRKVQCRANEVFPKLNRTGSNRTCLEQDDLLISVVQMPKAEHR